MKANFFKVINKNIQNRVITQQERLITQNLTAYSKQTVKEVLQSAGSRITGLTTEEVEKKRAEHGRNIVVQEKRKPWYLQLLMTFKNPFNFVLLTLAVISFLTGDHDATIIIVVTVLISVIIKFTQEYKSGKSAEALRTMVHSTCNVVRLAKNGQSSVMEIPMEELVPGDILQLASGDIIPADIRLLHSKNIYISQSALTGESLPIEKSDTLKNVFEVKNPLELDNICFMGTNVDIGIATAMVIATGTRTYFGAMAKSLAGTVERTSFDIGVDQVSWLLIRFMLVMVPVVFFIAGFTKGDWLDALLFALSVAVGLTPEMLPVVVTSNLAKGAVRMAKEKVVVKKLNAIQNFGAMNILCTDKTGTLTEDRIVLIKHIDIFLDESKKVLEYAYLNSFFQSGLRNLMDVAVLDNKDLEDRITVEQAWVEKDELPFDFVRRRMSVILQKDDARILICKGAVEEMVSCSAFVSTPDGEVPIDEELKATIKRNTTLLNNDGLRVVAVGHKPLSLDHQDEYTMAEECSMVLDGFVAFLDPPKESAKEALEALKNNGIRVMVLTGDNDIVAGKVCREVGLIDDHVLLGSDLENLSDADAIELIEKHVIFAKLAPMQKSRIVKLLREKGYTVGYMGDGINDAVSLREADIGISVDTAVNISKESADIILLQKSLMVLNKGVIEGRKTFANTMKYIKITASSNFGNVFSLLGASALFPFLPMLPLQILILNLIYDFSQISIPWDNVDAEYLAKPKKWVATDIKRFMLIMGPSSSIFDYATFAVLFFVFGASTVAHQSFFQTGWFIESLLTQTLVVQILRTEKIPFLQSRPSAAVLLTSLALLIVGISLPYTGIGKIVGFTPLPLVFFAWLAGILAAYCIVAQLLKQWYIKRFNSWL